MIRNMVKILYRIFIKINSTLSRQVMYILIYYLRKSLQLGIVFSKTVFGLWFFNMILAIWRYSERNERYF